MSDRSAERIVVLVLRLLAISFAAVGAIFIITPNGTLDAIESLGNSLGGFDASPATGSKLWLSLGFAYMVVITGIAWTVSLDVVRYRPLLLVLTAGKAASSLTTGAFFAFDSQVFIYLLNFLVDGGLVIVCLVCWQLAGRVNAQPAGPAQTAESST